MKSYFRDRGNCNLYYKETSSFVRKYQIFAELQLKLTQYGSDCFFITSTWYNFKTSTWYNFKMCAHDF